MAERRNQTLVEAVREMLEEKSMPRIYWAEAIRKNRLHIESNICLRNKGVTARILLRVEAEFGAPTSIRQHCICAYAG